MFIKKIEKEALLKPLQTVVGIVERKQTMPILSNILIEKEFGKIRFTSTDLEIQITTTIEAEADGDTYTAITVAERSCRKFCVYCRNRAKYRLR